ncbi:LOG family protein [Dioscorea alata]|uniref:LOG family protein n=1 Tax=Dioscorea alata TaxID=55571 RepID=A0ACB7V1G2_DIOAL|nr:LOG family protein [Dioscorea alata]
MSTSKFKTICVFCGSNLGKHKSYQDAAIDLGKELVMKNINLVYGGGNIELMGLISQTVFNGGRQVLGIIPKALMDKEITGVTIGEVKPVENMHQRKAEMTRNVDAFIAMPSIHNKPVGLLNSNGYYNSLLSLIDQAVEEGFINPSARHIIVCATNAKQLIEKLEDYYPCPEQVSSKLNWNYEQLEHSQKNVSSI